jgi:hypothetical protein
MVKSKMFFYSDQIFHELFFILSLWNSVNLCVTLCKFLFFVTQSATEKHRVPQRKKL